MQEIKEEAGILAEGPEPSPVEDNTGAVIHYFKMIESRLGYDLLLGGTKHFGLYCPGDSAWNWQAALRRMEDKLGKELALPEESRVLDAGCGVGDVAGYLAQHYGLYVCGIDILDFNITAANRRAIRRGVPDRVAFRRMSYAELDFHDETFDGCYTMETLVHAADAEVVLQEFYRVLKPGARLVLLEYSREAEQHMPPRAAAVFRRVSEVAAMPSYQRFEHGVLERLMEQAGFAAINRHQLAVLRRQPATRPKPSWADRALIAALLGMIPRAWASLRMIVTPDTVLRWHRDIIRPHWAAKSRRKRPGPPGDPPRCPRPGASPGPRESGVGLPQDSR